MVTDELLSFAELTSADSVKKAMRCLALEAIMRPESLVELRDLLTRLSGQHPDGGPLTTKVLTALSHCANEGRAAPATPIEDAIRRLLTANEVGPKGV